MAQPVKTEAELQARIEQRLRAALPLLPAQIQLERNLHLRLGHHRIVIDGVSADRDGARGRYDVLVLMAGKPLLIAELKAPGVLIGPEDIAQALSYARLHEPPVPLVVVTNGADTRLRRTYDGDELSADDLAAHQLATVLATAASVAATSSGDAIRTLLGASHATWSRMLSSWTDGTLKALTGSVQDFRHPITRDLDFERRAAKDAAEYVARGDRVVAIHGPPLSGVTHVLVQIARMSIIAPCLFVDGKATPDILQSIATRLTRELSFSVSRDDVRGWLNTSGSLMGVTLVIDGLPRDGLDELIETANAGYLKVVLGLDSETFRRASTVPGRNESSQLGRAAVAIALEPLSDNEFDAALMVLDKVYHAGFFNGAQHIPQLRWPRTLRVIAATLQANSRGASGPDGRASRIMLPAIPGPMFLATCSRAFASDPALKIDLRALAKAYLIDVDRHIDELDWVIATWGRPSVDPLLLEKELGEARMERLRAQGYLSWVETHVLGPRVLVRVEEILGYHVADEWASTLRKGAGVTELTAEIDRLLRLSAAIPGGDVVLATALSRAAPENELVLSVALPMLINQKPTISRLKEGARFDMLVEDAWIRVRFGEGMDEEVVGGLQAWMVLSHLASSPILVEGYEATGNFSIFETLGTFPHLLYKPPVTELARVPAFHMHDIAGIGSIPCVSTGIVEPLLQAMLDHAHSYPDEFVELSQVAKDEKEPHLAWRTLTVAIAAESSADPAVARASAEVFKVLRDWWGDAFEVHAKSD